MYFCKFKTFFSNLIIFIILIFSISSFAAINVSGNSAENIWNSVKVMSILEKINLFESNNNIKSFNINHLQCVFERYNACSFFTELNNHRKMRVVMAGTAQLMNSLSDVGVRVDTINARMAAKNVYCQLNDNEFECVIEQY